MDFETEEQQVEALKKWWKENARNIIAGVVIGISAISGWRYYVDYQKNHEEYASALFENILQASTKADTLNQQQLDVNKLLAEYSDTPYASLSALILARSQFISGDIINAQQNLDWVMKNSKQTELQHLARIRMMRLLFTKQQYEAALKLADIDYPESFSALYEELKGDLYVSMKKPNEARLAYDKAIFSSKQQVNKWLQLKRDDLGESQLKEPSA